MVTAFAFPVLFLSGGFCFQLIERFWPLRRFQAPRAVSVDILALVWAAALTVAYGALIAPSLRGLPELSLMHSIRLSVTHMAIPPVGVALIAIVLVDFLNYWGHRLIHTRPLWPTHAFHHSATNMYWIAGVRESPVHYVIVTFPSSFVGAAFPPDFWAAWMLAILIGPILNQHFIHSNIRTRLGPLGWIFVTPRYHFIHHAADRNLSNTNFGFIFSFWDRLFGTYTDPTRVPDEFPLGLDYPIATTRLFLGAPPA